MIHLAREVFLYGLASAAALIVDVAILVGLVQLAHVPYLLAAVISFTSGGFVAYALSVRFIFRYRRVEDRRLEATSFIVLGVAGLIVNTAGIAFGVEVLGLNYLVAKLGAAGLSFIVSYSLRRLLLFTPRQADRTGAS